MELDAEIRYFPLLNPHKFHQISFQFFPFLLTRLFLRLELALHDSDHVPSRFFLVFMHFFDESGEVYVVARILVRPEQARNIHQGRDIGERVGNSFIVLSLFLFEPLDRLVEVFEVFILFNVHLFQLIALLL